MDEKNLGDYLHAARDGEEPREKFKDFFRYQMCQRKLELFLARVDGEPAGTGGLLPLRGGASFLNGEVRPKFRGRGVYLALLDARMERLRRQNIPAAVVLAKADTSAPILRRRGFFPVCPLRTWEKKF